MANTLPSLGVLSMDFLPAARQLAVNLKNQFSTDFSAGITTKGTAIAVPYQTSVSASLWNATNKYASADETVNSATVTMKEPYYVEFYISPNERASLTEDFLKSRMGAAVIGVLEEVEKQALYTVSNATDTPTLVASVSASQMNFDAVQSGSIILINSGSQGPKTVMCTTNAFIAIQRDAKASGYQIWNTVANGAQVFSYGLGNVQLAPRISTSTVVAADAVAIALRLPAAGANTVRTIVTDPDSGVSVAVDLVDDDVGGIIRGRALVSAGIARGRPGSAARYSHP